MREDVWAVVPLKSPAAAKTRLSAALDPHARQRLMLAMAHHVVRTLRRTPGIAGVAVATAAAEVGAHFERDGATFIPMQGDEGTAQACRAAAERLSGTAGSVLMISGDLPLIEVSAVSALLEAAHRAPAVAIAPDRRRVGTNALLCAPPELIEPCFGPNSFRRHLAAAKSCGIEAHVVESDALGLDIDDVDDLEALRRRLDTAPASMPAELLAALSRDERVALQ